MSFQPSEAARRRIDETVARYPERSAALLPVLRVLQEEIGFVPPEAEIWVGERLGIEPVRVREVLTFYDLLRRRPAGRTTVRVCRNLSCTLAGAEDVLAFFRETLALKPGGTTADGRITLTVAECLGNCDRAPCLQIDGVDVGPVDRAVLSTLLEELQGREGR